MPVFITLAIGILCRTRNVISRSGMDAIRNIAVNITLPAVLILSFASADYSAKTILIPVTAFVTATAGLALGYTAKAIFRESRCFPFMLTGFEAGMLGYGLFALLFRGQSNSMLALLDLGGATFVFTLYKALLCGKGGVKSAVRSAVTAPTLWAIVLGVVIGATGLYDAMAPSGGQEVFNTITGFISAPTSVLILLGIGYDLDFSHVHWNKVLRITASRIVVLAVMFLIFIIVNNTLLKGIIPVSTLLLFFILPPPYVVPVFADEEEEKADISTALSLCTVLCLTGFTIMAVFV